MTKKYIVRLTDAERRACDEVVSQLKGASQKARRARILLKADADGPAWTDEKICEAFGCRAQTVEGIRQRFVTEGFEIVLNGKLRESPPTAPQLDGEGEAKVIALRLGKPAAGYGRWTLRLLAGCLGHRRFAGRRSLTGNLFRLRRAGRVQSDPTGAPPRIGHYSHN